MRPALAMARGKRCELGQSQQRDQREDRDHRDVLHQQHREAGFAPLRAHQPFLGERLDDDRGRTERQHHADRQRGLPWLVGEQRDPGQHERGQHDLSAAEPGKLAAHLPQALGLHLESDDEQHHHHAELGEDLQRLDIDRERGEQRRYRHAGKQVAEHRTEPEARGQRDREDPGHEDQEGQDQETGHTVIPLALRRVSYLRYGARAHSSPARFHALIR